MEENNNKKGKRGIVDTSVVLSFVVAVFAVFSLAMAGISMMQNSGVSYAAPTTLPSEFAFNLLNGGETVVGSNTSTTNKFTVPMYVADNNEENSIFCVEHNVDPDVYSTSIDNKYTAGEVISDYGLLYLLNKSYVNGVSVTDTTGPNSRYVEAWITQTAIWMYLYETDATATQVSSPNHLTAEEIDGIKKANKLTKYDAELTTATDIYSGDNLYTTYVKPLVDAAKSANNVAILNVSKENDELSKSDDKKYYFSSLITVTGDPSSALKYYTITLDGIEGAKAVDEVGEELPATITSGTKFYVRIPAEKVTTEVQKVKVTVNGTFTTLEGKYFNAATANKQKVVSVTTGEKNISKGVEVEFVGTEDTGMSTFQTIYFIGLIVLLCGVGIVYANAKPVQVKQ